MSGDLCLEAEQRMGLGTKAVKNGFPGSAARRPAATRTTVLEGDLDSTMN
jgi:hypothetical protein